MHQKVGEVAEETHLQWKGRLSVKAGGWEKMQGQKACSERWLIARGNHARRKKKRREGGAARAGKTSERKLLRTKLQTEGGVQREDPGDRGSERATGREG